MEKKKIKTEIERVTKLCQNQTNRKNKRKKERKKERKRGNDKVTKTIIIIIKN